MAAPRALGYQEDVEVDLTVRAVRRGDQYLLCSDGLSGHVADDEMHRVFNCGIGMVLAVGASDVAPAIAALQRAGEQAFDIGEIVARPDGAPHAIVR